MCAGMGSGAGERRSAKPTLVSSRIRLAPRRPEQALVVEVPVLEPYPTTGVGAFCPYPECAAVGMPLAGVKMCQ